MQRVESVRVVDCVGAESMATKSSALDSSAQIAPAVSSVESIESAPADRFYPPVVVREESRFSHVMRTIRTWYKKSDRFFHLLVGMPSYDKYVEHMRTKHPDREIKSQAEFFKEALDARYNGGVNRCC